MTRNADGTIDLHIYVDRASVEVFANGYTVAGAEQIFPKANSLGVSVIVEGGAATADITVYPMGSIWNPRALAALTRGMTADILHQREGGAGEASAWAVEQGLIKGYEDGSLRLDAPITREQLAVVLHRYAGIKGIDTSGRGDLSAFSDHGEVSGWAAGAVRWAAGAGLLPSGGKLTPKGHGCSQRVSTDAFSSGAADCG